MDAEELRAKLVAHFTAKAERAHAAWLVAKSQRARGDCWKAKETYETAAKDIQEWKL
jgi:hypothetical protein